MSRKPELRGRAARLARLLPTGGTRGQAARAPFVLLVVVLLGGGLIGLLVLNSALSEGSFQLDDLKQRTKELTDEEQALQRDIDAYSAPRALQRRARELGMVPGGDPAFLDPDGSVKGSPSPAPAAATPLVLAPEALTATSASPSAPTPSAYAEPSAPAPTSTTAGTSATPTPAATPTPTPTPGR
ncbi:septum formation initiator family protein [Streptomyces sp. G3]|uniref:septum formation initiator family protein n=1 Tax=unclassified Streptomyces TaxID=2593676 RepID=UPI001590E1CE|nr:MULTISPECIES: septum formation initiator family protein [unclassified Streptomyces]MCM1941240.1 septum formation initiator family protein [Streptomyces sp. G3]QKW63793.1 septum formation initiator family protein [Streptomyces sp. NA03103]